MTIIDINDLQDEVKEARFVVSELEKLKKEGMYGEFINENFDSHYHAFQGHGFQRGSYIGDAVLDSMKFDWKEFELHLVEARKNYTILTKELQIVNGYLGNIRLKESE